MIDKGFNLFNECTARCARSVPTGRIVHLFFLRDSKMYTSSRIANSQRMQTEINESGQNKDLSRECSENRYTVYRSAVLKNNTLRTVDIIFI